MNIAERIQAVHLLQRFVHMSRNLLPRFSDLTAKQHLTPSEKKKMERIKEVYESFEVNPEVSVKLVNSNIFQLIQEVYQTCQQKQGQSPESFYVYNAFLQECDRLIETWNRQNMN